MSAAFITNQIIDIMIFFCSRLQRRIDNIWQCLGIFLDIVAIIWKLLQLLNLGNALHVRGRVKRFLKSVRKNLNLLHGLKFWSFDNVYIAEAIFLILLILKFAEWKGCDDRLKIKMLDEIYDECLMVFLSEKFKEPNENKSFRKQ